MQHCFLLSRKSLLFLGSAMGIAITNRKNRCDFGALSFCETLCGISGPEGPRTPVNGRLAPKGRAKAGAQVVSRLTIPATSYRSAEALSKKSSEKVLRKVLAPNGVCRGKCRKSASGFEPHYWFYRGALSCPFSSLFDLVHWEEDC